MAEPPHHRPRPDPRALLGLALLAMGALALRLWGLGWGLPNAGRYYPYHPDELVLLHAVCQVNPLWGDWTPDFYNYGSLYILLTRLCYDVFSPMLGWGAVPRFDQPFPTWVTDFAHLQLLGRGVTVALGVGTVLLTYALGKRLFSARAGWIAAAFTAVAPGLVMLGHYMTVDVPGAFFTTLTLLLAAIAVSEARAERAAQAANWSILAGAAAGLAAGTKYNGVVALLSVGPALWIVLRKGRMQWAIIGAVGAVLAAGAAFLLSTPGALLQTDLFTQHVTYELGNNRTGQGDIFTHTAPAWLYHLHTTLPIALEWPLFLLALAGVVWSMRRRSAEDAVLWLFIGVTFLALAGAERKFVRYVTPLIPPLLVLAGRMVDEGLQGRGRRVWAGAAAVAGAAALASVIAHLGVLSAPDARDEAAEYLKQNAGPSDLVMLGSDPWWYTPPIDPTAGAVKLGALYGGPPVWDRNRGEVAPDDKTPSLASLGAFRVAAPYSGHGVMPAAEVERLKPRFVVMSDIEYEDPERLRRWDPGYKNELLDLEAALEPGYTMREIRPRPSLLGFTWWSRGIPPHDWRYYMPAIRIYERK